MAKPISLEKILFSQGFGTRRYCSDLVYAGLVKLQDKVVDDPEERIATEGLVLNVEGKDWEYHEKAYLAFNSAIFISHITHSQCGNLPYTHSTPITC